MNPILEARGIRKVFRGGDEALVEVLNHVDLVLRRGEVVAIVGASGAGKSTLLHLLGALDEPSSGDIVLDGQPYSQLTSQQKRARRLWTLLWFFLEALGVRVLINILHAIGLLGLLGRLGDALLEPTSPWDELRNAKLGFVFQFHHLLREFTALENVMMPLLIAGWSAPDARERAEELLAAVGLAGRMAHRPAQLSGGEQQRCAVARALVHDPKVLLADEPSGNLDAANSERLHELLFGLARELETALVIVTHNPALAERADRILLLENGRLQPVDAAGVLP